MAGVVTHASSGVISAGESVTGLDLVSDVTQSLLNVTDVGFNVTDVVTGPQTDPIKEGLARILGSFQFKTARVISRIIPEITFIFGFSGNILAYLVIVRMRPFTTASLFLSSMAVSDFFNMAFNLAGRYILDYPLPVFKVFCSMLRFFTAFTIFYSLGLVMALCVERSLAVWRPFEVAGIVTKKRSVCYLIMLLLGSTALSLPHPISYRPFYVGNGVWFCNLMPSKASFFLGIWRPVELVLTCFFPAAVFISCTIIIIVGMKRSTRFQQSMTSDDLQLRQKAKQSRQITTMLVSVVVLFILTYFPYGLFKASFSSRAEDWATDKHLWIILFTTIFTVLRMMNSALNCYCYFFTASRFRAGVYDLLTFGGRIKVKCLKTDRDPLKSGVTNTSEVSGNNSGMEPSV